MGSTIAPRLGAMLLTIVFLAGTSYVLFEDVLRHGAPFTTTHVLTVLTLLGAFAAGLYFMAEIRGRHWLTALGCAVVFVAATAYIVTASGARNADAQANKVKRAEDAIAERARVVKLRDEAQQMLSQQLIRVAEMCRDGVGKYCKGAEKSRDTYQAAVKGHDADLAKLAPASAAPNAGYAHAGRVFAAFPYVTAAPAEITARLELLMPFVLVLIAEIGTLVFGHIAFRGAAPAKVVQLTAATDSVQTSLPSPTLFAHDNEDDPDAPPPGGSRERTVRDYCAAYKAKNGTWPRTRDVMRDCALPKASASRWRAKALAA